MIKRLLCVSFFLFAIFLPVDANVNEDEVAVDKFYNEMKSVQSKYDTFFVDGMKYLNDEQMKFRIYKKVNNYRLEIEVNGFAGKTNKLVKLYKDNKYFYYIEGQKIVNTEEITPKMFDVIFSTVTNVFNWNDKAHLNLKLKNKYTTKNGYNCRALVSKKSEIKSEICVSDKYGLSIDSEFVAKKNKAKIDVITVKTGIDYVPDSVFELPENAEIVERVRKQY